MIKNFKFIFLLIFFNFISDVSVLKADERKPNSVICNVMDGQNDEKGAVGDGVANDHDAIQRTIDSCPEGGIVLLPGGKTFLTGSLTLKGNMTFRIEPKARLKGSRKSADYPDVAEDIKKTNTQSDNCRKALLFAERADNLVIEGSEVENDRLSLNGIIDGSGDNNPDWNGPEKTRPMAVFIVNSANVTLRNIQVLNSGMWSVVYFQNTGGLIDHIRVDSHSGPTRDGIDLVDCSGTTVQYSEVTSEDDSVCLKTGDSHFGLKNILVQKVHIKNSGVANALKIGTATVGPINNIRFLDIVIDRAKQAAMAVESVDGSIINGVSFKNITFNNVGMPVFVLLGKRKGSKSLGSISNISFNGINPRSNDGTTNLNWGSAISGPLVQDPTTGKKLYLINNISINGFNIRNLSAGGLKAIPSTPADYAGQYPDPRMWETLPAYGFFVRNVDNITFQGTNVQKAEGDPRQEIVTVKEE